MNFAAVQFCRLYQLACASIRKSKSINHMQNNDNDHDEYHYFEWLKHNILRTTKSYVKFYCLISS